jgi:hypothetical protein
MNKDGCTCNGKVSQVVNVSCVRGDAYGLRTLATGVCGLVRARGPEQWVMVMVRGEDHGFGMRTEWRAIDWIGWCPRVRRLGWAE